VALLDGDDPEYRRILQTTFEVVEEEVGSLRRLVSEFSSFARLPRARIVPSDLSTFLRDQAGRFAAADGDADDRALFAGVEVAFDVPAEPMPALIDEEMLHRVLVNLIRNAAQAIGGAGRGGKVIVRSRALAEGYEIVVDDDGPGIAPDVAPAIFDPYVTTKRDGTGLGLSIVKKIVVDHGGSIEAGPGPLGGARFRLLLPSEGSVEAQAALEKGDPGPESSRAMGQ
jgi:signal transduction histidine kinase